MDALPRDKVLSDCSLAELKEQCERGVEAIVANHNKWLRDRWEKTAPRDRQPFKPFKTRKLSNLSYTTLHKYLHRRNVNVDGDDCGEDNSNIDDGSV